VPDYVLLAECDIGVVELIVLGMRLFQDLVAIFMAERKLMYSVVIKNIKICSSATSTTNDSLFG